VRRTTKAEKAEKAEKADRVARENLARIVALHEEYLAKVPSLDYSEEVKANILRGGKAYLDDRRRAV